MASRAGGERPLGAPSPRSPAQPRGSVLHPQPISRPRDRPHFGEILARGEQQPLKPALESAHTAPSRCPGPNLTQLLPTVRTKPLMFAPEMPEPPLLVLVLLPGPDGRCFPGARGHAHHADPFPHKPVPHLPPNSGPMAPIWAPSPNPFPQPLDSRQIVSRESRELKQPQTRIHGFPRRRITDTRGASPSARCVWIKSRHETVTIVRDP